MEEPTVGRYVPAPQFVAEIADDLGIDNPNILRLMPRWIWHFQFQANAKVAFTQRDIAVEIQHDHLIPYAPKPCDFVWLVSALLADRCGKCQVVPFYEAVYPIIQGLEHNCPNRRKHCRKQPYRIQEQNDRFDLSGHITDEHMLYLRYRAFNLDPDTGFPMCDRTWMESTKLWIKTCIAMRENTAGTVSITEVEAHYRLTAKLSRLAKSNERKYSLPDDAVDQIMARYLDPLATSQNAVLNERLSSNLNYENTMQGSPGYGYPAYPDKW
jgi:hypothetical protein